LETETALDRDATGIAARVKKLQDDMKKQGTGPDKIYRGQAAYTQYIDPGDTSGQIKGAGIKAGPIRANIYARAITRMDYQPDICKDYKETGYCGFGDSCKFMHDRGDYKSGWEIDRDWNEEQKQKKLEEEIRLKSGGEPQPPLEENDNTPFACSVCNKAFTDPVKTKCGHFFCAKCALRKCKTECAICTTKTGASFATPSKVEKKKLDDARKRHEAKKPEPTKEDDDEDIYE